MKKTIRVISFFVFMSFIAPQPGYPQQKDKANPLIYKLGEKGKASTEAHIALIEMGETAVPPLCKALQNLDPSMSTDREVNILFGVLTTLGKISETKPQTMKQSVPALLNAARNIGNRKARTYILSSLSILFGRPAIPYLIDSLKAAVEHPPANDKNSMTTQGFVSATFINMGEVDRGSIDVILDHLDKELKTAKGGFKGVLVSQIVTLAPDSKRVVPILEKALQSEVDPHYKKFIQDALKHAKEKSR